MNGHESREWTQFLRMRIDLPHEAMATGFVNEPVGTHTSRTLMLGELRGLLATGPPGETYDGYQSAAVALNAVRKATHSTRQKTFRHLRELYSLSSDVPLFTVLRTLWDLDQGAQPLLAAMCAVGRDPLLRCTIERVINLPPGSELTSADLSEEVAASFPGHYSPGVVARIGRNVGSSWTQAGLLMGRSHKVRVQPPISVASVTYALFVGFLAGERGDGLFVSPWARMLDHPEGDLRTRAAAASRQGWLEYRETGGVTEITFRRLQPSVHNVAL